MSWIRMVFFSLIALLCLLVTVDYVFDRTELVNQKVEEALVDLPMQMTVGKVKHRVTQLGQLELQGVSWRDEFGDSIAIDNVTLKLNWRALLSKTIDVKQLTIEGVEFTGSEQGLKQLQSTISAGAQAEPDPAAEQNDTAKYLPHKLLLDALTLKNVNVNFATEHQRIELQKFNLAIDEAELTELMQFEPVNLSLTTNLAFERFAFDDNEQQLGLTLGASTFALHLKPRLQVNQSELLIEHVDFKQPSVESSINKLTLKGQFLANWLNDDAGIDAFNWQKAKASLTANVQHVETQLPLQQQNNLYALDNFSLVGEIAEEKFDLVDLSVDILGGRAQVQAQSNLALPLDIRLNKLNLTDLSIQHFMAKPVGEVASSDEPIVEPELKPQDSPQPIEPLANLFIERFNVNNLNAQLVEPQLESVSDSTEPHQPWFAINQLNLHVADVAVVQEHLLVDLISLNTGAEVKFSAQRVTYTPSAFDQLTLNVKQTDSALQISDTGLSNKDGRIQTQGSIYDKRRISEELAIVSLQTDIYRFDLAALEPFMHDSMFKPKGLLDANVDADLQFKPNESWFMEKGDVQIKSGPFGVDGIAMDKLINGFKASQETSLLDVGSFLVAGPVGMMAMQFVELSAGAAQFKGKSQIKSIEAIANVQNNIVKLDKARLKTTENSLGFIGNVNLNKQAFEKFTFAILDDNDCPTIQQTLDGKFTEVKKVLFNTTSGAVTSPLSNVWRKAKDVASGGCKSFFAL